MRNWSRFKISNWYMAPYCRRWCVVFFFFFYSLEYRLISSEETNYKVYSVYVVDPVGGRRGDRDNERATEDRSIGTCAAPPAPGRSMPRREIF